MATVALVDVVSLEPPGPLLKDYDRTALPESQSSTIPTAFIDLMQVRKEVFVDEQRVPLENEYDWDDARSFHLVAYVIQSLPGEGSELDGNRESSKPHTPMKQAAGTVRLVPHPHPPHPDPDQNPKHHGYGAAGGRPYFKLGRLAVRQQYRKMKLGGKLVNAALEHIAHRPKSAESSLEAAQEAASGRARDEIDHGGPIYVLVHAQKVVQKVWEKYGFVVDPTMGEWQEEEIWHVGMWRELDPK